MAKQITPFLPLVLEKKPVELVKPSKHTHCENLSLSTLDSDLLNEVMYATIYVTVRELEEASISDIAKHVKKAKKTANEKEYLEEELKNLERLMRDDAKFEGVSDGLLFMTDWKNIGWFGSMDFGWNEPVNLRPVTQQGSPVNVWMILKPSKLDPSMGGGVKVIMKLPRDAMAEFKREMDAMNKIYFDDTN